MCCIEMTVLKLLVQIERQKIMYFVFKQELTEKLSEKKKCCNAYYMNNAQARKNRLSVFLTCYIIIKLTFEPSKDFRGACQENREGT